MAKKLDIEQLKAFSPLDGLKNDNLHALLKKVKLERTQHGRTLFDEGDTEKYALYVLSGTIELREGDDVVRTVTGGTAAARTAVAPTLPRAQTAVAAGVVRYIKIDSELLDVMLTWDQTGSYAVDEGSGEQDKDNDNDNDDWMTILLQIRAFHKIPPANIQAIFMRLQEVSYSAGDAVIKQGDPGDYFYIITRGGCLVTRETPLNKDGIQLAQLAVGDTFGEEALISEAKRNATITMKTNGTLMRLAKDDFQTLLEEPLLEWLNHDDAEKVVAAGGQWLDVRLPNEFEAFHEDGAVNVPLYFLRLKLDTLDLGTKYVVCCDTGRRSSAAAFILNEHDFQTVVLKGGLTQGKLEETAT
jgi:CRP-like cAMP-binding protein